MSSEPSFDTLPLRDEPGAHALVPRFWLLVVGGPDTGATFTSSSERTVIGTYDICDLVLHDSTVSRFHCEIEAANGALVVRDLGSLNGTTVNGVAVLAAQLECGVTIGAGKSQIRFDVGSEPVKVPLSERRSFGGLAGDGPELRRLFALLERAAATSQAVLLEGPAPLAAAEAIHEESARRGAPFVTVDCSAVLGGVLEEVLFGRDEQAGAFEAAQGGTLYLAEIADVPLELQPKLLRVLARREVKRAGAAAATPIDVRVIAGTHRNLRADVNAKRFRSDLYFCVATHEVRVPLGVPEPSRFAAARAAHLAAAEKSWAEALVARHGGNLDEAARAAGLGRPELRRLLAGKGSHA